MESDSNTPTRAAKPRSRAATAGKAATPRARSKRAAKPAAVAAETLLLPAHCSIHEASLLKAQLLAHVDTPAELRIDSADLERIDTAGIQLLTVFVAERSRQNRTVCWGNVSPVLGRAADSLGVQALLGLPAGGTL